MAPAVLAALIGVIGPQLLGRLFGGGGNQDKLRERLARLFSPEALAARTNANQAEWYKSPAYGAAQASSLAAGRMAEASVTRAGAGVTSGMDVLQGAAAAGLGTATLGKFNADAYQQSRSLALQQAQGEAGGLLGAGVSPDTNREMLGASLGFLGPLLANWYKQRYGGVSGSRGYYAPSGRAQGGIWGDPTGSG